MTSDEKKDLRGSVKHSATLCSADSKGAMSNRVLAQIEALPQFRQASTVALFWSLPDEVSTHLFVQRWSRRKRVVLPVVDGDVMCFREVVDCDDLSCGAFGISEPRTGSLCLPDTIDFMLVPGVAFDASGHRLGRGRGYYDRYLKDTDFFKVGVCFDYQLVDHVPCEPHDICVDMVISASR